MKSERNALILGKICALVTVVAFLFMPLAGCGQYTFSGMDLLSGKIDSLMQILSWLIIIAAFFAFISPRASILLGSGLLGLIAIGILLFRLKGSGWESQMVEIKTGSFVTIFSFIAMIIIGWWEGSTTRSQQQEE